MPYDNLLDYNVVRDYCSSRFYKLKELRDWVNGNIGQDLSVREIKTASLKRLSELANAAKTGNDFIDKRFPSDIHDIYLTDHDLDLVNALLDITFAMSFRVSNIEKATAAATGSHKQSDAKLVNDDQQTSDNTLKFQSLLKTIHQMTRNRNHYWTRARFENEIALDWKEPPERTNNKGKSTEGSSS